MANSKAARKWSELRNTPVIVPKQGRTLGTVEDFYFKPGTNSVYALCVRMPVLGNRSLPVTAIQTIDAKGISIDSEQMLIKALPPLPTSQNLHGSKVVSDNGTEVGTVDEILLNIDPPVAMRIAGLELAGKTLGHRGQKGFSAEAISGYDDDAVVIHDSIARRLH
ncbi:hypothetical protein EPA93_31900 [Ktedonosporobacter rubrisoli]|uniref:PRC-barrel domain-containing protein n=1 Tax=Ktedonosporobacter rubrisoli TaxID=2509675 RepID=A0A4P6JX59_KTERU|nr:hypothetical protein [Ktedonosporobacter rubrisoli]QBD80327.1 hypothetical protein EPA93_31900 [Ktedonosporobacter rubrisoli]